MKMQRGEDKESELILRTGRLPYLANFFMSSGFTVFGAFMVAGGNWQGWFVAIFFGLCSVVFLVLILPGASYLRLTPEGFTYSSLYRRHVCKWAEVGPCFTGSVGGRKRVLFQLTNPARSPRLQGMARAIWGAEGCLPDSYGMTADDLASLMNDWRRNNYATDRITDPNS